MLLPLHSRPDTRFHPASRIPLWRRRPAFTGSADWLTRLCAPAPSTGHRRRTDGRDAGRRRPDPGLVTSQPPGPSLVGFLGPGAAPCIGEVPHDGIWRMDKEALAVGEGLRQRAHPFVDSLGRIGSAGLPSCGRLWLKSASPRPLPPAQLRCGNCSWPLPLWPCGVRGVLAVAQKVCERRGWLTQAEFLQLLATAQVLPGPNVCNLSLMIGDRFFGWRGALAALAGMIVAPMAVLPGSGVGPGAPGPDRPTASQPARRPWGWPPSLPARSSAPCSSCPPH